MVDTSTWLVSCLSYGTSIAQRIVFCMSLIRFFVFWSRIPNKPDLTKHCTKSYVSTFVTDRWQLTTYLVRKLMDPYAMKWWNNLRWTHGLIRVKSIISINLSLRPYPWNSNSSNLSKRAGSRAGEARLVPHTIDPYDCTVAIAFCFNYGNRCRSRTVTFRTDTFLYGRDMYNSIISSISDADF